MVQPRRIPFSSPASAPLSSPSIFASRNSERPILYDLNNSEKKSPHAGSFRSPLIPKTSDDLDETIRSLESQLRSIESDVESKKAELQRLKRENAAKRAQNSKSASFFKRFLFGILFVLLFMLFDFTLRIIISKYILQGIISFIYFTAIRQQFELGNHINLDKVTEFYKEHFDWLCEVFLDLRSKYKSPF